MDEEAYLASYSSSQELEVLYEDPYRCIFQSMPSILAHLCPEMIWLQGLFLSPICDSD